MGDVDARNLPAGFKTLKPLPGEVVVITLQARADDKTHDAIYGAAKRLWPQHDIIILDGGARIGTLEVDDLVKRVDRLETIVLSAKETVQDRALTSLMDIVEDLATEIGKDTVLLAAQESLNLHRRELREGEVSPDDSPEGR